MDLVTIKTYKMIPNTIIEYNSRLLEDHFLNPVWEQVGMYHWIYAYGKECTNDI